MKHAMDGGARDVVTLRQLAETLALSSIPQDADAIEVEWLATNVAAFELGAAHAGAHPLDDEIALQLGDGTDDHDDRPTQRAAGIDLFAEADEFDIEMIQLIQHLEEVFHRPGQPVRGPDQDHIEAAAAGVLHHFIETRASSFGTADLIGILCDDLIIALNSHLLEIVELGLRVLRVAL